MRICKYCKVDKPIDDYSMSNWKKPTGRCRACQNAYCKEHYKTHKRRHNNRRQILNKVERKALRVWLNEQKLKPCVDCFNVYHPFVMDFDHRPEEQKCFEISRGVCTGKSKETLLIEIAKCDLVCANCHRLRTLKRNNWGN